MNKAKLLKIAFLIRRAANKTIFFGRHLTSSNRGLPDFMIIGVQKGGTTSLFHYLTGHPQIKLSFFKETHFFNSNYDRGLSWYKAFFSVKKANILIGEATPCYFFYNEVPARIKSLMPQCKFIVVLRNPVDRAISHYKMNVRRGNELIPSFEDAIKLDNLPAAGRKQGDVFKYYSYLERGLYAKQLKHWLTYFPIEQFLFLKSEDLLVDPAGELDKVFEFLNIGKHYPANYEKKNAGTRSAPKVNQETLRFLVNYFHFDDKEVARILGPQFSYFQKEREP